MQNRLAPHPHASEKNQWRYLRCRGPPWGARGPKPTPGPQAQGSSARKRSPRNFWLWKPAEIVTETEGVWQFLFNSLCTDLFKLTCSELQHWDSGLKDTRWSGIEVRAAGAAFSQTEVMAETIIHFLGLPHTKPAGWCHIWVSIYLTNPVFFAQEIPWDPAPPHPTCRPIQTVSSGFSIQLAPLLADALDFLKTSQTSSIWPWGAPHLFLTGPRPSSQPWFAAWLPLGTFTPRTTSNHLQIALQLMLVALDREPVVSDISLHLPEGPRASAPCGQLQAMSKHHPTISSTMYTFKGWTQQVVEK